MSAADSFVCEHISQTELSVISSAQLPRHSALGSLDLQCYRPTFLSTRRDPPTFPSALDSSPISNPNYRFHDPTSTNRRSDRFRRPHAGLHREEAGSHLFCRAPTTWHGGRSKD